MTCYEFCKIFPKAWYKAMTSSNTVSPVSGDGGTKKVAFATIEEDLLAEFEEREGEHICLVAIMLTSSSLFGEQVTGENKSVIKIYLIVVCSNQRSEGIRTSHLKTKQ